MQQLAQYEDVPVAAQRGLTLPLLPPGLTAVLLAEIELSLAAQRTALRPPGLRGEPVDRAGEVGDGVDQAAQAQAQQAEPYPAGLTGSTST